MLRHYCCYFIFGSNASNPRKKSWMNVIWLMLKFDCLNSTLVIMQIMHSHNKWDICRWWQWHDNKWSIVNIVSCAKLDCIKLLMKMSVRHKMSLYVICTSNSTIRHAHSHMQWGVYPKRYPYTFTTLFQ